MKKVLSVTGQPQIALKNNRLTAWRGKGDYFLFKTANKTIRSNNVIFRLSMGLTPFLGLK